MLLIVYGLYALTNILFISNSRVAIKNSTQTIILLTKQSSKLRGEKVIFRLMDRSTVSKNHFEFKPAILFLLCAFTGLMTTGLALGNAPPLSNLFYNKQYSYLSFRVLRI